MISAIIIPINFVVVINQHHPQHHLSARIIFSILIILTVLIFSIALILPVWALLPATTPEATFIRTPRKRNKIFRPLSNGRTAS
jgi:hypothetical protein